MEVVAVVVCRRCCGEVCSATSVEAVEAAAGAEADSVVAAAVLAVAEALVEVSEVAVTLAVAAREAAGSHG